MSEQQSAAATALAGGDTPAPADVTPPASPLGVKAAVDPGAQPVQWQAPEWAKDLPPEELGYIEKKKLDDPKNLLKSYRELERTLSDDRVALPKDWANKEETDKFFNKAGRPESPDKYVPPKGADPELFKALAPGLHEAGLNQQQVDKAAEVYSKVAQAQMDQQVNTWIADQNTAQEKLEREWGNRTPQEIEHNRRAMRALGISVDDAVGYMRGGAEKFLRLLNVAGHVIAEDNSGDIASDATLGFGLTANRASAELAELRGNAAFMERVRNGDMSAKAKYDRLIQATADAGLVRNTIKSKFKPMPGA